MEVVHWVAIGLGISFCFFAFPFGSGNLQDSGKLIFGDVLEIDDVKQIMFACGIIYIGTRTKYHEMHAT